MDEYQFMGESRADLAAIPLNDDIIANR